MEQRLQRLIRSRPFSVPITSESIRCTTAPFFNELARIRTTIMKKSLDITVKKKGLFNILTHHFPAARVAILLLLFSIGMNVKK